ncbi:hypothetical protein GCM10011323_16460 [Pontibacter amylolyticus]|uniref:Uncharacterized protein n=1 Tax=Pontibacter amylolyticus TaxID=1424080 RepID=A0ABQ1W3P4_9BACT|nr:hypothetical protein GCM10011323_16460 [Pontibacter amylolyticus]
MTKVIRKDNIGAESAPSLVSGECELLGGLWPLVSVPVGTSGGTPPDSSHSRDASEGIT